jgi:hypothetical protein
MTSLIEQLQSEALDSSASISDLLRKAKTVAVKLGRSDLGAWVEREMSGYSDQDDVPDYRYVPSDIKFRNPYRGWCPVIGSDHVIPVRQSCAEIASLLEGDSNFFTTPVPTKIARRVIDGIGFTVEVSRHIYRNALIGILDNVRNAVLDWALKLEQAGVKGDGLSFSSAEADKAKSVTINIGSIGNAVGIGAFGDNAAIQATQTLSVHELSKAVSELVTGIERELPKSGLPSKLKNDAQEILENLRSGASQPQPDAGALRRGLQSLMRIMEGAGGNIIAAGIIASAAKLLP